MDKSAEVKRLEKEAVDARLSPSRLSKMAGIDQSTWWRVRQNPERLTLDTLAKIETAIKARRVELDRA